MLSADDHIVAGADIFINPQAASDGYDYRMAVLLFLFLVYDHAGLWVQGH